MRITIGCTPGRVTHLFLGEFSGRPLLLKVADSTVAKRVHSPDRRSHATSDPPSSDATHRSSVPRKARPFPWLHKHHLSKQIYTRWCCVDRLNWHAQPDICIFPQIARHSQSAVRVAGTKRSVTRNTSTRGTAGERWTQKVRFKICERVAASAPGWDERSRSHRP